MIEEEKKKMQEDAANASQQLREKLQVSKQMHSIGHF